MKHSIKGIIRLWCSKRSKRHNGGGIMAFLICLLSICCIPVYSSAQSNDYIFPASKAAKHYIDFDARGFIINGKRTFLVSAGLEYARIPHELWHDRLLRLKRAGFNCVEIYTFWNFHEPKEGKFDFSGDHDLNAFLQEVHQLGMYAIVRVGPYYCAEWDLGGYPHWLKLKPGLMVRSPNAEFEKYVDRFFAKLIPVVAKNQINHGGAVVMVQLENEHPAAWGTYMPNEYFEHLRKTALSLGLEVPYFFSGLHHSGDPAGDRTNLDDSKRPNPWFTTEFWSVWYNRYGSDQKDADEFGNRTWKIIAHGGNGYNYYMAYGGTNFGYTNNNEDAASYDYGAAVGQAGDLRPMYYQFKENALFARSFQDILENSVGGKSATQVVATNPIVRINSRKSPSGEIVFLENPDSSATETQVKIENHTWPSKGPFAIKRWEFVPIVHNFSLTNNIAIDWSVTKILGVQSQGKTRTIVVYGKPNSAGEIWFSTKGHTNLKDGSAAFNKEGNLLKLNWLFNTEKPVSYSFVSGDTTIRVLTLNTALSNHTWFLEDKGLSKIVVGPEYIGDVQTQGNHIRLETEAFWDRADISKQVWIYDENTEKVLPNDFQPAQHKTLLQLADWQYTDASLPAQPDFDDHGWFSSQDPMQMGADGDLSADAWYRTSFDIATEGWYKLNINKGGDRFIVFIDGRKVVEGGINDLEFQVAAGHHVLAVYTAHNGRDKLYNFTGDISKVDIKGIAGEVTLHRGKTGFINDWKVIDAKENDINKPIPSMTGAAPYKIGTDPFHQTQGYAWFQATIPSSNGRVPASIHFGSVDDKCTVFINGQKVGGADDWNEPFSVPFVPDKDTSHPNIVTLFVENKSGPGGIDKPVEVLYKDDIKLQGWKMKGGPGNFSKVDGWEKTPSESNFGKPAFFKSYFSIDDADTLVHPVWRVIFRGLSHGFIWVNGHNLGTFPERVPVNSLYIPECWLKEGNNEIVIYDEYGNKPDKVQIQAEAASSRDIKFLNE